LKHVIVIGGGAAGCMAAVAAAQKGAAVTLLERNPKLGRKLYITGKGRCNVTNDCAAPEVLQNVPRNSRFLTSAVTRFPPEAVKAFFEGLGVPLKTERGNSSSIRKKSPYTGDMKKASAQAEALGKGTGEGGRVAEGSGEAGSGSHPQGVR